MAGATDLPRDGHTQTAQVLVLGVAQLKAFTVAAGTITNPVGTNIIRVIATEDCYIRIGFNPTAVVTDTLLIANQPEYFGCDPGDKVSAIRVSADGVLQVTAGL